MGAEGDTYRACVLAEGQEMRTLDGISRIERREGGVVGWWGRRIFVVERGICA